MSRIKPKKDRNIFSKDGKWYLDFTAQGKRIRSFGGYTKEQARNALAKLRIEKLDERLGFRKPEAEPIPFEVFADEFLQTYCKQNKKSWQGDEIHLENLKGFFKGETLQSVGPEMVERYKAKRRTEVSPATVNRGLSCLRTLFNKAVEWGRLETSPLRTVKKLKEPGGRERILCAEEAARLIKAAASCIRPVLIVALNTGMRRNEILSLKWKNVDLARAYLLIEESKSGRPRKIPMNAAVIEALRALPRDSEFVFYNPETRGHIQDVKTAFKKACRLAKKDPADEKDPGIEGLRFHDLRHTAASKMIEAGVDLVTVSKILGHASIQMTMRYAHPTPDNMKLAVNRLAEILDPSNQKVVTVPAPAPLKATVRDN